MSDLVNRLREYDAATVLGCQKAHPKDVGEAADKIEQLERELTELRHDQAEWMAAIERANKNGQEYAALQAELAAEKSLADRLYAEWMSWCSSPDNMNNEDRMLWEDYRKARGL